MGPWLHQSVPIRSRCIAGPLAGLKIIEMAGIGQGPFCAMVLADIGAEVVRVVRPGAALDVNDVLVRSRTVLHLDLRDPQSVLQVLALVKQADVLIEGYRPGVMERLGLGPDVCLARQPRLVYGRMTGWGQLAKLTSDDIRGQYSSLLKRSNRQADYAMQVLRAVMRWHGVVVPGNPLGRETAGRDRIVLAPAKVIPAPIPPERLGAWWRASSKAPSQIAADYYGRRQLP